MQRLKKNCSLFEINPALVKEWHPSANGNLTPRNVTVAYPEKIWWICEDGHEWKAKIKSRLKGNGCPVCKNWMPKNGIDDSGVSLQMQTKTGQDSPANSEKTEIHFDGNSMPINIGRNFRKGRRFRRKAVAVLEVPDSGYCLYAHMKNISRDGLCFETEAAFKPGTVIKIKIDKSIISTNHEGYKSYNSIIRWCKEIDNENPAVSTYGCGVEFIGTE
jgi:hypothetical protein